VLKKKKECTERVNRTHDGNEEFGVHVSVVPFYDSVTLICCVFSH
jgi:hypothetical protein